MSTPMASIGLYEVAFSNGTKQLRHLILQADYDRWYARYQAASINRLPPVLEQEDTVSRLRLEARQLFGDTQSYFTTDSPMGKAMDTGVIEIGEYRQAVTFTKLTTTPLTPAVSPL